jgi:hypothetical protein
MNLAGFFDAVDQFVEQSLLHLNAEDTPAAAGSSATLGWRAKARFTIKAPAHDVAAAEAAATKLVPRRRPLPLAQ